MAKKTEKKQHNASECASVMLPVRDALHILSGRWKLPIISALTFGGNMRFTQISKQVNGITDRMLSKELKELEVNQLVKRTVYDAFPPVVEYSITPHGLSLGNVILALRDWGKQHRKKIMEKTKA